MAYIEEADELMTDATGQSIATAIGNMSATSVGNLSALQTTDKTSLVGAVNEVRSGLTSVNSKVDGVVDTTSVPFVAFLKVGRMVFMTVNTWHEVFTIPAKYRPLDGGYFAVRSSLQGSGNDTLTYLVIGNDGAMVLGTNDTFVGSLSWIADNLD